MSTRALPVALLGALLALALAVSAGTVAAESNRASARVMPVRYRPVGCVAAGPLADRTHGARRREVALTFDDGPSIYTQRFVQMLRAQKAVATFFMIGEQVSTGYRSILREELRDGDALGDHTWTHANLPTLGSGAVSGQLSSTKAAIASLSGYTPCVFRPPYGTYDTSVSMSPARSAWTRHLGGRPGRLHAPGCRCNRAACARPNAAWLDRPLPRRRWPAAADVERLSAHNRRVEGPRLSLRYGAAAVGSAHVYMRCRRECGEAAIEGAPPPGSIVRG